MLPKPPHEQVQASGHGSRPVVGLLGGIGSGKSAVARILAECGADVIDADRLASDCLDSTAIRSRIEEHFGPSVLRNDGTVDRRALADRVFTDETSRRTLEQVVHPPVLERMRAEIERLQRGGGREPIVIDAPLLIEAGFARECDLLVMVRAPRAERLARVSARRGWDRRELDRREGSQAPLADKERAAHRVIDNDGTFDDLQRRVESLHADLVGEGPALGAEPAGGPGPKRPL